ncbi:MAG: AAA family ATPase [Planctomycetota bacterium]|jgi:adenylate kinase family enzyme
MPRIHVVGGAGTGTTTLARALSSKMRVPHLDSDDYYWVPTVPPYKIKRPPAIRDARMIEDLEAWADWVWSGSAVSWSVDFDRLVGLVVFLTVPRDLRLARLRAREEEEHRDLPYVSQEEIDREISDFMEWAERYEEAGLEVRSRQMHESWLAKLACPILRLDGDLTTDARVRRVLDALTERRADAT